MEANELKKVETVDTVETVETQVVEQEVTEQKVVNDNTGSDTFKKTKNFKGKDFKRKRLSISPNAKFHPEHLVNFVVILKHNAEIARFTGVGVLNYLYQKKEIPTNKGYVDYLWDKFVVHYNGLKREFRYSEDFFIKCFVASFTSFAANAEKIINTFCIEELNKNLNAVATTKDVDSIVLDTFNHINNKANGRTSNE